MRSFSIAANSAQTNEFGVTPPPQLGADADGRQPPGAPLAPKQTNVGSNDAATLDGRPPRRASESDVQQQRSRQQSSCLVVEPSEASSMTEVTVLPANRQSLAMSDSTPTLERHELVKQRQQLGKSKQLAKEEWFKQMYSQMHRPAVSAERSLLDAVNQQQQRDESLAAKQQQQQPADFKIKLKSPRADHKLEPSYFSADFQEQLAGERRSASPRPGNICDYLPGQSSLSQHERNLVSNRAAFRLSPLTCRSLKLALTLVLAR